MSKVVALSIVLAIMMVGVGACASEGGGSRTAAPPTALTKTPGVQDVAPWRQKWNTTIAAARKEGTVTIYTAWSPKVRKALTETMRAEYGINLEFVVGRGAEQLPRIQAEQSAGKYFVDVIGQGNNPLITSMKPLLGPIEPLLVLPEVLDPKAWPDGKVPFADSGHLAIPMTATAQRYLSYNTSLVKAGELRAYEDALKPQYKGKIILSDPSIAGSGNGFFTLLAHSWGLERAKDYFRRLLTEQQAAVNRDYRIQVEELARGKYYISLGGRGSTMADFIATGAPVANALLKEVQISNEAGVIGVPKIMAHPNATAIFVNWLLTKQGQTIFSKSNGTPVMRKDVSTGGINPVFLVQPGEKVTMPNEDFVKLQMQMMGVASKMMAEYAR